MRPILVGEDNPYGGDPYFALYPAPDGCSGHRLCCNILCMSRDDYLLEFQRANLCDSRWSAREARLRAAELVKTNFRIITLGKKVASAFGLDFAPFCETATEVREGWSVSVSSVLMLPHPSGRCRTWNEPGAFRRARLAVLQFLPHLSAKMGRIE